MLTNEAIHKSKIKSSNTTPKLRDKNIKNKSRKYTVSKCKTKINPSPRNYDPRQYPYRNGIGVTLFLNYFTRPDISYAVNNLGRRQCTYSYADWKALQRLMRYIKDTANLGITYTYNPDFEEKFDIFVDASLGTNNEDPLLATQFL